MFVIWIDDVSDFAGESFAVREWRWHRPGTGRGDDEGRARLGVIADMLVSKPDDVTLLLSARVCLHLSLTAPPMSARNLDLALPYLAEEHIASSVEDTHFVPGTRHGDQLTVFGMAKSLLRALLDGLSEYGIAPVAAYSDASLIPLDDHDASLLLDGQRVLLRSQYISLEADFVTLPVVLPRLLPEESGEDGQVGVAVLNAEDESLIEKLAGMGISASVQHAGHASLAALASQAQSSGTNLLTCEFASQRASAGNRQWRLPSALAASLLVFVLVADNLLGITAQTHLKALQTEAMQSVDNAMTTDEIVRLVNREQGDGGQETSYFIDLLAKLSSVVTASGANLKSLSYQQGSHTLDVEVLVSDYDGLDQLSQDTESAFAESEMLGATQTENGVRARLRLAGL